EAEALADGTGLTVGIRPEYVSYSGATTEGAPAQGHATGADYARIFAPVVSVENLGASVLVTGRIGEERLQGIIPDHLAPQAGAEGEFSLDLNRVVLFDAESGQRVGEGSR